MYRIIMIMPNGLECSKCSGGRWSAMKADSTYINDREQIIVEKHYQKQLREDKLKRILKDEN